MMKRKSMYVLLLLIMLSTMVGCRKTAHVPESEPSESAETSTQTPPSMEQSKPNQVQQKFKAGTWLATGGDVDQFYFFDADSATGRTASLENGTGLGFTYEGKDGKTIFHMGDIESPLPCRVIVTDEEHITLEWEAQYTQTLTYYSNLDSENFFFYTNEELCQMALREYETKNGLTDSGLSVGAETGKDGSVTLQIYQNLSDHNSTVAWYQVDRCTAKGPDVNTGEVVELANQSSEIPD